MTNSALTNDPVKSVELTVALGETASATFQWRGHAPTGIRLPAELTSTACEFQMSPDGGDTWFPIHGIEGDKIEPVVAASTYVALPAGDIYGVVGLGRIVMGSAEAAARIIHLSLRALG